VCKHMKCTYFMIIQITTDRDRQMTDPASHQRRRPTETKKSNFPTENFRREIMSAHKPRVGSAPRHTDWPTVSHNITLLCSALLCSAWCQWQTRSFIRASAPQRHDSNRQTVTNNWSWEPEGASHQDWLTVSHNMTFTLAFDMMS
jgi:hypothetical protein